MEVQVFPVSRDQVRRNKNSYPVYLDGQGPRKGTEMSNEGRTDLQTRDLWLEALDWHTHLKEASGAERQAKRPAWLQWKSDPANWHIFEELSMILDLGARACRRPKSIARQLDDSVQDPTRGDSSTSLMPLDSRGWSGLQGGWARGVRMAAVLGLIFLAGFLV